MCTFRWVETAKDCGISKFEISHFFTQWGAKCAPNIYVTENGERKLKFGWHTAATDPEYAALLHALLPQLLPLVHIFPPFPRLCPGIAAALPGQNEGEGRRRRVLAVAVLSV